MSRKIKPAVIVAIIAGAAALGAAALQTKFWEHPPKTPPTVTDKSGPVITTTDHATSIFVGGNYVVNQTSPPTQQPTQPPTTTQDRPKKHTPVTSLKAIAGTYIGDFPDSFFPNEEDREINRSVKLSIHADGTFDISTLDGSNVNTISVHGSVERQDETLHFKALTSDSPGSGQSAAETEDLFNHMKDVRLQLLPGNRIYNPDLPYKLIRSKAE